MPSVRQTMQNGAGTDNQFHNNQEKHTHTHKNKKTKGGLHERHLNTPFN